MPARVTITGPRGRSISHSAAVRQVPFATALALTRTAQDVKKNTEARMRRVLDNPKPYTLRSLAIKPATKRRPQAEVFFKEFAGKGVAAGKYLLALETGGRRRAKRAENAMVSAGILLEGERIIPADGGSIDLAGLRGRGVGRLYTKILSGLKASSDPFQNATLTSIRRQTRRGRRAVRYFVTRDDAGSAKMIWERISRKIVRPVLIVVRGARYRKTLGFKTGAVKTFDARIGEQMKRALEVALRTAR